MSRRKLPESQTLAGRILLAKKAVGLSRSDLSRKTGLSLSYISRIESGQRKPSRYVLRLLASVFRVNPEWLASGKGDMKPWPTPGVEEGASLSKGEPRTWEVALEPYISGTPIEGSLSRLALGVGPDWNTVWRDIPEKVKTEIRRTIRTLASAALILEQLPDETSKPLALEFKKQIRAYISRVFRAHATGGGRASG